MCFQTLGEQQHPGGVAHAVDRLRAAASFAIA
jgi:hypothetical protein